MRDISTIERELEGVDERMKTLLGEARNLVAAAGGLDATKRLTRDDFKSVYARMTPGQRKAEEQYRAGLDRLIAERDTLRSELHAAEVADNERRLAYIGRLATNPANVEGPPTPTPSHARNATMSTSLLDRRPAEVQRAAFDAIAQSRATPRAQDRLDRLVRDEPTPVHARYIAAVASDAYASAFRRVIADPARAALELLPEERLALIEARTASDFMAVALSTAPTGGYALPMQLDPTLILSSEGSSNPLRRISRVETLTQKSKKLVTTTGVTAAYGAEGSDVAETPPVLAQPEVTAHRATAYVELTFELWADWSGATSELSRLFADAKDNLEAEKFLTGTGTNEPEGLLTSLLAFDDAPAAVADLIAAQNDLSARWQANSRWLMSIASRNLIGQFVAEADTSDAKVVDEQGNILHRAVEEASYAGTDVVLGDFRAGFAIGDRLGMSVEPIPVVYNVSSGVPKGSRALLAIWRSGSSVIIADAFRLLGAGGS